MKPALEELGDQLTSSLELYSKLLGFYSVYEKACYIVIAGTDKLIELRKDACYSFARIAVESQWVRRSVMGFTPTQKWQRLVIATDTIQLNGMSGTAWYWHCVTTANDEKPEDNLASKPELLFLPRRKPMT